MDINEKTLETLNKEYPNIKVKNLDLKRQIETKLLKNFLHH